MSIPRSPFRTWRKRRSRALVPAICVFALGGYAATGGSIMGVVASQASAAAVDAVGIPDPLQLLGLRSPGARGGAELRSIKRPRPGAVPHERVLSHVRRRQGDGHAGGLPDAPVVVPAVPGLPVVDVDMSGGFYPGESGGARSEGGYPPGPPAGIIGGGGGGVPGLPETPAPVSPVPEPATWLSMIVGFAIVGLALRRMRPALRRPRSGEG